MANQPLDTTLLDRAIIFAVHAMPRSWLSATSSRICELSPVTMPCRAMLCGTFSMPKTPKTTSGTTQCPRCPAREGDSYGTPHKDRNVACGKTGTTRRSKPSCRGIQRRCLSPGSLTAWSHRPRHSLGKHRHPEPLLCLCA